MHYDFHQHDPESEMIKTDKRFSKMLQPHFSFINTVDNIKVGTTTENGIPKV